MVLIRAGLAIALTYGSAFTLLCSGSAFAQNRTSIGVFSLGITLNGVAPAGLASTPPPATAGACVTQTLFNVFGAVVRVTCVDNPFVSITPSIDMQFPGKFGSTFRYPLYSNPNSFNLLTGSGFSFNEASRLRSSGLGNNFNSPASIVTDLSIYRTESQATIDAQGETDLINMVISF